MTVLEGRVPAERAAELNRLYAEASRSLPPQMLHTYLVQGTADPAVWRGISVWRSRAALEEYRRSVATPAGIQMFQSVGAQPSISMWDVAVNLSA
jgi:quinol monooxygenase YgiN